RQLMLSTTENLEKKRAEYAELERSLKAMDELLDQMVKTKVTADARPGSDLRAVRAETSIDKELPGKMEKVERHIVDLSAQEKKLVATIETLEERLRSLRETESRLHSGIREKQETVRMLDEQ